MRWFWTSLSTKLHTSLSLQYKSFKESTLQKIKMVLFNLFNPSFLLHALERSFFQHHLTSLDFQSQTESKVTDFEENMSVFTFLWKGSVCNLSYLILTCPTFSKLIQHSTFEKTQDYIILKSYGKNSLQMLLYCQFNLPLVFCTCQKNQIRTYQIASPRMHQNVTKRSAIERW